MRASSKTVGKAYTVARQDNIPAVAVFEVTDVTVDGEIYAMPVDNETLTAQITEPIVIEAETNKSCTENDRILVKLKTDKNDVITGQVMRVLGELKPKPLSAAR